MQLMSICPAASARGLHRTDRGVGGNCLSRRPPMSLLYCSEPVVVTRSRDKTTRMPNRTSFDGSTGDAASLPQFVRCAVCDFENTADAGFCTRCGNAVQSPCPACRTLNLPGARFCNACGTPQSIQNTEEAHATNRVVTALFADVSSSTAVAERFGAEDWAEIAGRFLVAMSGPVDRFGGNVARLMGDGILALFGAPVTHEDDAERAVRAGMAIVEETASLRRTLLTELPHTMVGPDELLVRVGINSGPVVAGDVGGSVRSEYTAMGDAVNVAARLEQSARPGTVLISASTLSLAGPVVLADAVEPLTLKGQPEPVIAYEVREVRSDHTPDADGHTATVGRVEETAALMRLLTELGEGRGGIAFVIGEAGMGKSRIIRDVREKSGRGSAWLDSACLSFEPTIPYALARKVLARAKEADNQGLEGMIGHVTEDRRDVLLRVLSQVEGVLPGAGDLGPVAVASAFAELLVGFAQRSPDHGVVICVEDLHWVDEASADLMVELFSAVDSLPVVFICTIRPDRTASSWRVLQAAETEYPHAFQRVLISSLDPGDMAEMVGRLLGLLPVEPGLTELLVDRSGGNPYFLEELVRDLRQSGAALESGRGTGLVAHPGSGSQALPVSLQSLFQARFDRLDAASRASLELASVIGRTFDRSLLIRLRNIDVAPHLAELQRVGLIQAAGRDSYSFRHALAQEAVYLSIVSRERRRMHQRVGEAMESGQAWTDRDSVLASHFLEAGDTERGARYSLAAGDFARSLGASADARGHYDRGIESGVQGIALAQLTLGRGRVKDVLGDLDGGLADLESALELSRSVESSLLEWEVLIALGGLWAARDYTVTGRYFSEALNLARHDDDTARVGASLNRLGNWHLNASDPRLGIAMHKEALVSFEELGDDRGIAASNDLLGMAHALTGDPAISQERYASALATFRELDDKAGVAEALMGLALCAPNYELITQPPLTTVGEAVGFLNEALGIVATLGWQAGESYARFLKAQVVACGGDLGSGLREARAALEITERIGHEQWSVAALIALGSIEGQLFRHEAAHTHLLDAYQRALVTGSKNWQLMAASVLSLQLLDQGDGAQASELASTALALENSDAFSAARNCRLAVGWAAARAGDSMVALSHFEGLDPRAPAVALARAEALVSVDVQAAIEAIETGLGTAMEWGMPNLEWRLRLALARFQPEVSEGQTLLARQVLTSMADTVDEPERAAMLRGISEVLDLPV